jgi:hypothetical protein
VYPGASRGGAVLTSGAPTPFPYAGISIDWDVSGSRTWGAPQVFHTLLGHPATPLGTAFVRAIRPPPSANPQMSRRRQMGRPHLLTATAACRVLTHYLLGADSIPGSSPTGRPAYASAAPLMHSGLPSTDAEAVIADRERGGTSCTLLSRSAAGGLPPDVWTELGVAPLLSG